ncbi:hypothetical protein K445DRAFT_146385 [Daldinia sp. EC12]|nr:hypothetical protein K445DRAFT_146385 [Daldinia sp. EC12]
MYQVFCTFLSLLTPKFSCGASTCSSFGTLLPCYCPHEKKGKVTRLLMTLAWILPLFFLSSHLGFYHLQVLGLIFSTFSNPIHFLCSSGKLYGSFLFLVLLPILPIRRLALSGHFCQRCSSLRCLVSVVSLCSTPFSRPSPASRTLAHVHCASSLGFLILTNYTPTLLSQSTPSFISSRHSPSCQLESRS